MYAQNEGHIQRWTRTDNLNVILIHVLGSTFPILRRHVLRKLFTGLAALKFEIKSAFEGGEAEIHDNKARDRDGCIPLCDDSETTLRRALKSLVK